MPLTFFTLSGTIGIAPVLIGGLVLFAIIPSRTTLSPALALGLDVDVAGALHL